MAKVSFKPIYSLVFFASIIFWLSVDGQEIKFESNYDRNNYYISKTINYFSSNYDLTIQYGRSSQQLRIEYPYKVFAKKGKKFYKLDYNTVSTPTGEPTNFKVKRIRKCSQKEGTAFMDSLMSHNILALEPQDSWRDCITYDSVHKQEARHFISDGGTVGFSILNKESYRANTYDAVWFFVENCPSEPAKNIQALIDLFEKHW